jgi:hypothetical protein
MRTRKYLVITALCLAPLAPAGLAYLTASPEPIRRVYASACLGMTEDEVRRFAGTPPGNRCGDGAARSKAHHQHTLLTEGWAFFRDARPTDEDGVLDLIDFDGAWFGKCLCWIDEQNRYETMVVLDSSDRVVWKGYLFLTPDADGRLASLSRRVRARLP